MGSVLKNRYFIFSVATAVFISLVHILFCIDVYDDIATFYGPMAAAFGRSDWATAFTPNVPIFNSTLAGLLVKCGLHPFTAMMTISCFFYILGIPLVYLFAKVFVKRNDFAAMTCLLYAVAPKIIRFGCTGLLNSSRNTFALAAVVLLLYFRKKASWLKSVLLGIVLAGLALCRGEAIVFAPLFALWLGYLIIEKNAFKFNLKTFGILAGHWAAVVCAFLICVSPRMVQMYRDTGAPVLDIRQAHQFNSIMGKKIVKHPERVMVRFEDTALSFRQTGFGRIWQGVECFTRGAYTPYFLLAILGIIVLIREKRFDKTKSMLPFTVILVNLLVFLFIVNSVRYYTINLLMLLPFTFVGLRFIWELMSSTKYSRQLKVIAVLAMIGISIAQVINGSAKVIRRKYSYEHATGLYIQQIAAKNPNNAGRQLKVATSKPQYTFWSGALWLNLGKDSSSCLASNKLWLKDHADFIMINRNSPEDEKIVESIGFIKLPEQPSKKLLLYRKGEK